MTAYKIWLQRVIDGEFLSQQEARETMAFIMSEDAQEAQIGALLAAIQTRGHGAEELAGFAQAMRDKAKTVSIEREPLVDTCGTGGDGLETFNISTAAAFVAAGAGVAVAKHGNRAVSSKSGSADVLEALGIKIDANTEDIVKAIEETGFGFFFAPRYHPAMKKVVPVRRAMGVRTVFNLLGPLANPAMVKRQIVGVYHKDVATMYAQVLAYLGVKRAMVVFGDDGMDELTLTAPTTIQHINGAGEIRTERVRPEDVGLKTVKAETLKGGDAKENARLMEEVLTGKEGPLLDATLLNAGGVLLVADLVDNLSRGVESAREAVLSGKAVNVLEKLRKQANQ